MTVDHQELAQRIADGLGRGDIGVLESVFADDVVAEYPQNGRVLHGLAELREEMSVAAQHYAAGVSDIDPASVTGRGVDEHRVVAPLYTVVRVQGRGDAGTITVRTRYPDGKWWWVIVIYELRGDRIARSTTFFAEEMQPTDWSSFEPGDA
ncbi:MAG TPA: nuclear transport factor 2 family protein [Actinomycetota bacterium]|nr:nuclear transport factor 2 family protein [Actinomycetota bacterium]